MNDKYLWPGCIMFVIGLIITAWSYSIITQYSGILGQIGLGLSTLFNANSDEATKYGVAQTVYPYGLAVMGLGAASGIHGALVKDGESTCCG
jgi:hypothetical protein